MKKIGKKTSMIIAAFILVAIGISCDNDITSIHKEIDADVEFLKAGSTDLAQGKTATASSSLAGFEAVRANDGNSSTRWCAANSDYSQWWKVDLGKNYNLTGVSFDLEPFNGKFKYRIEVSSDGVTFSTKLDRTSAFYSGTRTESFAANSVRYVRITFTATDTYDWASLKNAKVLGNEAVIVSLAQGKAATSSSSLSGFEANKANDGNSSTRWCAASGNYTQWWMVDLGKNYDLTGTSFDLEPSAGQFKYRVEVSSNGSSFTTKADKTSSSYSGSQTDNFTAAGVRYVRITFTASNTYDWASFKNVEVNGSLGALPPIVNPTPIGFPSNSWDHREYMHGIDLVKVGSNTMVVFSSNNYPPTQPTGEWMHDIYYSWIDPLYPNESLDVIRLVNNNMGQEPASAAINSNGRIVITAEDAQHHEWLDQTYGMWDSNLNSIVSYGQKLMPPQGGHSGHVAASGDKFLVSFSDGWISGGAVDGLGTGDDIFGRIINNNGTIGNLINTSVGSQREWWPIVAGSDTNWLQVWQRYTGSAGTGGGEVWGAIVSHSGSIVKRVKIFSNNKYYYHDVKYLPELGLYLVIGSQNKSQNAGVAVLVNKSGNIVQTVTNLPNTIRQGQPAISESGGVAKVVYPTLPTGAAVLEITSNSITLSKQLSNSWQWDYMGVSGMFSASNRVMFAATSHQGVKFIMFDL